MSISSHDKAKLIDNNRKISELLNENENILREAGYDPPTNNYALERRDKISFPSGYIRKVPVFITSYHLREIFPQRETRHNVTYALEVSDLINYVFNRINIWGAVETVFYKLAIVNLISVMEAIVLECANNICCRPSSCGQTTNCSVHFSKDERNRASKTLSKLVQLGILDYDDKKLARVEEIIDLRNRIHIRLTSGNEMKLSDFNHALYNEVISLLQEIDEQIYKNGVPRYYCNIR